MRTKEELQRGCAELLKKLREDAGLTVPKMADLMMVDRRTWQKYEDGSAAPAVTDFILMFEVLGKDALKSVLDFLYPAVYQTDNNDAEALRSAGIHFLQHIASDRFLFDWDYLVRGEHGSNIEPQLQEWVMLDHLPMYYRYAIARQIYMYWKIAELHNEILNLDQTMPDVDLFLEGLVKGKDAVINLRDSYTTSIGDKDGLEI